MSQDLSQDLLHELFEYRNGKLYWRQAGAGRSLSNPAGHSRKDGYVQIKINRKRYLAHRLIFLMHQGHLPEQIDHIDGNPANSAIENLRAATHSQNMRNSRIRRNNTSGYKGVVWHKHKNKWHAQIRINSKKKNLGYFDCPKEAHAAYCQAANELHKDFANFG